MLSKMIFSKFIIAVIGSLLILLISAAARPIVAQGLQAPASTNWPTDGSPMATLTGWVGLGHPIPNGNAIVAEAKVVWHREGIRQIAAVPTSNVAFGPFKLKLSALTNDKRTVRAYYRISIQARSPALLEPTTGFVEIGQVTRDLIVETSPYNRDGVEANVWVKGIVPGVFSAIQLEASVVVSGGAYDSTISYFPSQRCSDLTAAGRTDRDCIQAAINPLAVVTPRIVPISIIYEPPGDESWSKLTNSHTAGATVTVEESNSNSKRTLRDASVLGVQIEGEDYETVKETGNVHASGVKQRSAGTNGTILSSGHKDSIEQIAKDPDKRGPGKGDLFILLLNPPLVYWDTEGMTNFKFLRQGVLNDQGYSKLPVYAWQLERNQGLPNGINLTCQERAAILALNPFFKGTVCPGPDLPPPDSGKLPGKYGPFKALPKSRFIPLNPPLTLPQYVSEEQTEEKSFATASEIRDRTDEIDRESNTVNNLVPKILVGAIAKGGEKAAQAAAGKFTEYAAEQWGSDQSKGDFKEMEKAIEGVSIPAMDLFKDETTTTMTMTYSRNKIIAKSAQDDITQHWFIQNTQRGMCVAAYYDTFFGTFAFQELPGCVGVSKITADLPNFVRPAEAKSGEALDQALPMELAEHLKAFGASLRAGSTSFEAAPADKYDVPKDFVKGLPTGMQFDLALGKLTGMATESIGKMFQALFYVKNAQGEKAAELWVTVQVFAPPLLEGAVDTVNCQTVSGRAMDKNNPRSIVNVDIFDGNRLLATLPANQLWKDPLPFDPGAGNQLPGKGGNYHGFSYPIPDSLKDGRPHVISVRFAGTGTSLAGSPKTISINPPPVITDQPDDLAVCAGKSATFSVTATGDPRYQWYKDGAPITGATGHSMTIVSVSAGDYGAYHVVISTGCSSVTSRSAQLTAADAAVIITQPASVMVCPNHQATFSVTATGADLHYQWYHNSEPITGAVGRSLTIVTSNSNATGMYHVLVTSDCGSILSKPATLTLSSAPVIATEPSDVAVCAGQQARFSVSASGEVARYQWYKDGVPFTGATGATLVIVSPGAADEGLYHAVAIDKCGQQTASRKARLSLGGAITITKQPVNVTACAGQSVTFSVSATGGNLRYLWRKNGGNITGAEGSSFTIPAVSAADAASYSVVVYNGCDMETSAPATLTVNAAMTLTPSSLITDSSAGSSSVGIRGVCSWTAVSNATWITITSPTSGNGNGGITYWVGRNTGPVRTGTMTIAGQTFTVTQQAGANADRNDARFVPPQTVPVSLAPSQRFDVSIRMKNTGQTTWTTADGYRLVSQAPVNNTTWGLREVALPSSVAPGAEATFNFTITAPTVLGAHRFEWAMMQGQFAFGSFSPAIEISVR